MHKNGKIFKLFCLFAQKKYICETFLFIDLVDKKDVLMFEQILVISISQELKNQTTEMHLQLRRTLLLKNLNLV